MTLLNKYSDIFRCYKYFYNIIHINITLLHLSLRKVYFVKSKICFKVSSFMFYFSRKRLNISKAIISLQLYIISTDYTKSMMQFWESFINTFLIERMLFFKIIFVIFRFGNESQHFAMSVGRSVRRSVGPSVGRLVCPPPQLLNYTPNKKTKATFST